jgi:hypothetical protein
MREREREREREVPFLWCFEVNEESTPPRVRSKTLTFITFYLTLIRYLAC